jgi:hypothetical protein
MLAASRSRTRRATRRSSGSRLADLVAIDGDDAFFTETQKEPRRLLRCDLRSGKLTSAMRLAGKNDVKSAFVRNGHVYALVFRDPSGVIAKAPLVDR